MEKRYELYDGAGNLLEVSDTRTVTGVVERRLALVRAKAAEAITGLGLTWMVEREVSGGKKIPQAVKFAAATIRTASDAKETEIARLAAAALDDDDKAACDAIEAVAEYR